MLFYLFISFNAVPRALVHSEGIILMHYTSSQQLLYIGISANQVFWVSPTCHILAAITLCFPTTHSCKSCQHHRHYLHYQHHTCFHLHTFITLSLNYIIAYTFPAESKRSNHN